MTADTELTEAPATYRIMRRCRIEVNTDPQRRCHDGCMWSSELRWTEWDELEIGLKADKTQRKLTFWRELNDYAISARGESACCEYKLEEEQDAEHQTAKRQ